MHVSIRDKLENSIKKVQRVSESELSQFRIILVKVKCHLVDWIETNA